MGRGAAGDDAAAPRPYPGGRLAATWKWPGGRLELGVSRGIGYRGLEGPLPLVDGRVVAEGAWAADGRVEQGPLVLQAVYVPAVPAVWVHNRYVTAAAGGVGLQVSPRRASLPGAWLADPPSAPARAGGAAGAFDGEAGPPDADAGLPHDPPGNGWLTAGVQWAWLEAGPQLLTFRSRPPLLYERREQALATYLQGRNGTGLRLSAAAGLFRWFERDGAQVESGWDAGGLVRVGHTRNPRWRVAAEAAGPRFGAPLTEEAVLSRDRIWVEGSLGPLAGPLRPRLEIRSGWTASGGERVGWSSRVQLRPPLRGPGGTRPVMALGLQREGGQEEVTLELGLDGRRWGAAVELSPSGPQLAAWWATAFGRLAITHLQVRQQTGRVEWRWEGPDPGEPVWRWHAVYKWRPRPPDRHLYVEASWQLDPRTRVVVYVGRWDRGQLEDLFGEPSRMGVALRFAEGPQL